MKTIKYYIFSLFILLGTASCSDFLDKTPTELTPEVYFNNDEEVELFLIGVYSPLMQEYFYGNNYAYTLAGGDDLGFYQRSTPVSGGSMLCANASSTTTDISNYWRVLYDGINRANMLLEGLENNNNITEASSKNFRAEALFLRAFYYFNLVQGWGDVPFRLHSVKSASDAYMPKTDKQEIYDKIISDIKEALPNLPKFTKGDSSSSVTQSAAQGILARIYMFRAGEHFRDKKAPDADKVKEYWEQVRYWSNEVIQSNIHSLSPSFSRVFLDYAEDKYNTGANETIWEVVMAGNRISSLEYSAGRIGNTIGFGSKNDYSAIPSIKDDTGMKNPGYSYRFIYGTTKLFKMYQDEEDTERGDWSIAPYEYTLGTDANKLVIGREYFYGKRPAGETEVDGMPSTELAADKSKSETRSAAKYRREHEKVTPKNKNYTPINFPILRYSDVLLMYAEAENELNGPTNAEWALNTVRERAKIAPKTGLDKVAFREAIKNERAMELCFEGIRRWDLIRWGEFYKTMRAMIPLTAEANWGSYPEAAAEYYKVTEAYVYFPIPDTEISGNPIAQNPGW
ncbi:RagB/SusD family nutrient uptake outer membrane protein [Dysgonomonas massiliensis]|uniref:RagB/SusD family nutrient uptake outer membrane protein n=1 Tax=Dysgonomonas massiliensis TaxID=2040292 RepID=UPI000C793AC8|nr:RagB/SusD family nutrient uptake outer membrane protein [Dysgonomonas massiliensis]